MLCFAFLFDMLRDLTRALQIYLALFWRNWAFQKHCFWTSESNWIQEYDMIDMIFWAVKQDEQIPTNSSSAFGKYGVLILENSTWKILFNPYMFIAHRGSSCWHRRGLVHCWVDWNRWVSGDGNSVLPDTVNQKRWKMSIASIAILQCRNVT